MIAAPKPSPVSVSRCAGTVGCDGPDYDLKALRPRLRDGRLVDVCRATPRLHLGNTTTQTFVACRIRLFTSNLLLTGNRGDRVDRNEIAHGLGVSRVRYWFNRTRRHSRLLSSRRTHRAVRRRHHPGTSRTDGLLNQTHCLCPRSRQLHARTAPATQGKSRGPSPNAWEYRRTVNDEA